VHSPRCLWRKTSRNTTLPVGVPAAPLTDAVSRVNPPAGGAIDVTVSTVLLCRLMTAVFVNWKTAAVPAPGTVAVTTKLPATALAMSVGAVARPVASVRTVALPATLPPGPQPGAGEGAAGQP